MYTDLGSKVIKGQFPVFYKNPIKAIFLLQITQYDEVTYAYALALVNVYGVQTDLGSKVIKGSFPVFYENPSKSFFSYKLDATITRFMHMY